MRNRVIFFLTSMQSYNQNVVSVSVVLMALVDEHYRVIVVGGYGRPSDCGILSNFEGFPAGTLDIPDDETTPGAVHQGKPYSGG